MSIINIDLTKTGIIVMAHGSPNKNEFIRVIEYITDKVRTAFPSAAKVGWAALNFNHPDLGEAIESLAGCGAKHVIVMPFFLFEGKHSAEDIPGFIEKIRPLYSDIEFTVTSTLGTDKLLADLTIKRIKEAIIESSYSDIASKLPSTPETIESRSMEIIESFLPPLEYPQEELQVIKRIVHASGDIEVAGLVRFHPRAISSGVKAIQEGKPIFTDVKMVATGINKRRTDEFGCSINCALDNPDTIKNAEKGKTTRAAAAIRHLGAELNEAIVVIGNAPTALFALIDLIDNSGIKPAIVVGMPVGFVGAKESKIELMKRHIPYIVVEGNRGGSALAVATVNALLNLA